MTKACLMIESLRLSAGNELLLARLANALDAQVVTPHVCCLKEGPRGLLNPSVPMAVFPFESVFSIEGLRQLRRFRRYLEANGIDAVHAFENKPAVFAVLGTIGTGTAVITSRLNCGYWYTPGWVRMFRLLNRFTTHVFANSAAGKRVAVEVEKLSPGRVFVFNPGVDLSRFYPGAGNPASADALGIPSGARVAGIVANFRPVKNVRLFLEAAAIVARQIPNAAFLLVGQGELKPELERLAAELGIAGQVFFSRPETAVVDCLARMSVACLSSDSEGLPNAIMEYMAMGLPVVSTDVGGVSELVRDGVNGLLAPAGDREGFAAAIARLLRDDSLCAEMGARNLERARAEFDGVKAARRLEQYYREVSSRGKQKGAKA